MQHVKRCGENYRTYLIRLVKAAGRDVTDMAEQIVGETRMINDLEVRLHFPQDGVPTIEIIREHFGKETMKVEMGEDDDEEDGD
jgi:hypothetical protein